MATPLCPICKKRPAYYDNYWGYLPCVPCRQNLKGYSLPKQTVEMTTPQIKEDRVRYSRDIRQPYRNGELSREYLEEQGSKGIKVTKREAKKAKYVWNGDIGYYKK